MNIVPVSRWGSPLLYASRVSEKSGKVSGLCLGWLGSDVLCRAWFRQDVFQACRQKGHGQYSYRACAMMRFPLQQVACRNLVPWQILAALKRLERDGFRSKHGPILRSSPGERRASAKSNWISAFAGMSGSEEWRGDPIRTHAAQIESSFIGCHEFSDEMPDRDRVVVFFDPLVREVRVPADISNVAAA